MFAAYRRDAQSTTNKTGTVIKQTHLITK